MRKYDKKNKRNIGIILVISFIIIVIFSYFVFRFVSTSKIKYEVLASSILYDIDKNMMELENDGLVRVKWNSRYYLEYNDKDYLLGDNAVIYTPDNGNISLYGKFYEIKSDATVEIVDKQTVLESSVVSHFYKIADRKYVLVSSKINTEDKKLDTSNYLIVELDKLGNATLTNNEVNLKTFSETKIVTSDYTFDVANEVLIYGEIMINLKKIIGSSNEYSPEDLLVSEDEYNDSVDDNAGDGTGNNTGTGIGSGGIGTGSGGTDNGTINNTTTYEPPTNSEGDKENNTNVEDSIQIAKRTSVIRVVPAISSISIDYVVYDPKDEYESIYVEVLNTRDKVSSTFYLNKNNTNINIDGLTLNTKYKLDFYYTYLEGNTLKKYNYNTVEVTTKVPLVSLSLDNISSNNIGYKIDLDGTYYVSSVTMELYLGDKLIDKYNSGDLGNVSSISGSLDVSNYVLTGDIVTVKLTNIKFGEIVNREDGSKVINEISYKTDVYYKFSY